MSWFYVLSNPLYTQKVNLLNDSNNIHLIASNAIAE